MKQITNSIMMIKPVGFRYNEQTAVNNYYQKVLDNLSAEQTQENALNEFNAFVQKLKNADVNVREPQTLDIFTDRYQRVLQSL